MYPTILLVDDDDAFIILIENALRRSRVKASLRYVCDGDEAISYLSRDGVFRDEKAFPTPALVLLDLKMPRMGGFEILQWKSGRPEFSKTPFVVLSSSDLERDKQRASELGAREYLVKPLGLSALVEMIERLDKFWSGIDYAG